MKVGDLVRHPLSGDIGIIVNDDGVVSDFKRAYYTVAFVKNNESFLIPQEHLEVINESR